MSYPDGVHTITFHKGNSAMTSFTPSGTLIHANKWYYAMQRDEAQWLAVLCAGASAVLLLGALLLADDGRPWIPFILSSIFYGFFWHSLLRCRRYHESYLKACWSSILARHGSPHKAGDTQCAGSTIPQMP